jgi:S-adenosylmethionine-diacylgycerolhomoserine-N-methlytransferase
MALFKEPPNYYRVHAPIYDATRWAFLFGRKQLVREILPQQTTGLRILDMGCGTGYQLRLLNTICHNSTLVGIDLSTHMLNIARRIQPDNENDLTLMKTGAHHFLNAQNEPFDIILCSYSLTIMGLSALNLLTRIPEIMHPESKIGVVDFSATPSSWFRSWMRHNHVHFDLELQSHLEANYLPEVARKRSVYGGLWSYFTFIGQTPEYKAS